MYGQMDKTAREQLLNRLRAGYHNAGKKQKSEAIHTLMLVGGYARKAAIRALNRPLSSLPAPPLKRNRHSKYDRIMPEIRIIWKASNFLCGFRLKAAIPLFLEHMVLSGELNPDAQTRALLLSVSDATLDRLLTADRNRLLPHGRCTTRPGSLLLPHIPVKTFSEWLDTVPGSIAVDWVAFCGGADSGDYISILSMTDISTAWVIFAPFIGRSERHFTQALLDAFSELPFPVVALHTDNDASFINNHVLRFCKARSISMTRTRPYKPNDNCRVEQKNWDVLRRFLGYGRYDTHDHLDLLARILPLIALYQNLFQPSARLLEKTRKGSKVHRTFVPPRTPLQQLCLHETTTAEQALVLQRRFRGHSPSKLLQQIHSLIDELLDLPLGNRPI